MRKIETDPTRRSRGRRRHDDLVVGPSAYRVVDRIYRVDVVAEGIETADDTGVLRDIGCKTGQGYFFSKPLDADAMTDWLDDRRSTASLRHAP